MEVSGHRFEYFLDDNSTPALPGFEADENDELRFALWQENPSGAIDTTGDLVLLAQYDADPNDPKKTPKSRRSPFKTNGTKNLALCLAQNGGGKQQPNPNDPTLDYWPVDLHLNGPTTKTYFAYSILALLNTGSVKVFIDPSIIINP